MKRLKYIDNMRGISILLIVIAHVMTYCSKLALIYKIIYAFHVPAFFVISGYIYNENNSFKQTFLKKFKRLIIPYFIYSILFLIPYYFLGKYAINSLGTNITMDLKQSFLEILYGTSYNQALKQNSPLWFLPALFTTEIIFYFIISLRNKICFKKIYDVFMTVLLLISGIIINKFNFNLFFGLSSFLSLGIFYYFGFLLGKANIKNRLNYSFYMIPLFIICILIFIFNNKISYTDYRYGYYLLFVLGAIIASLIMMIISNNIKYDKYLTIVGSKSMDIMIFHKLFIVALQMLFFKLLPSLSHNSLIIQIVFVAVTSAFTVVLCLIISKMIESIISIYKNKKVIES